jgi:hypothetical protein
MGGRGAQPDPREINSSDSDDERIIVDIATKVYCPQYSGR